MENVGFIKIYRQILNWGWYSRINVKVAFIHCLLRANYTTRVWEGIELLPGQFVTSYKHFAEECGLTVKQTRIALDKLQSTNEIVVKTSNKNTIISVTNWDKWQQYDTLESTLPLDEWQSEGKQTANEGQTNGKQTANKRQANGNRQEYKEYKELKKERNKENNVFFEIFDNLCKNLTPLSTESKNKQIITELNDFLEEIDYDKDYFTNLCKKADNLKKIVNRKIDFRSMLRNHIGIMNGKYEDTQDEALNVKKIFEVYKARKEN